MEVPMGGKTLTASVNKTNNDGSDDDIEVISSVGNGSGAKFGSFNPKRPAGGSLLKTKQNEDQGFEIIKEVPGNPGTMPRMGNPFGAQNLFNNPNLSSLAALMAGGNM